MAQLHARFAAQRTGMNLHFFWPGRAAILEYDGVRSHPDGRVTIRRHDATRGAAAESLLCVPAFEQRRTEPLGGTNKAMHEILAHGVAQAASRGGMDARAAWRLLAASAAANDLQTLHTMVMDLSRRKLLLSLARKVGQDSNLVEPTEIGLQQIFAQ